MIEFGALPPEINSAWIYTGPGAAPLMAAATAWHGLAAELGSTAAAYQSVVARMATELWTGSASASMVAAVTPYVAWMNTTAALAEQTAIQAAAAAAAFETAFAMTVPPPLIVANRSLLMTLVATNFLGQNTPAIAATEAQYAQMWAQDAAAMYGYAGTSAAAAQVTPFTEPAPTTSDGGVGGFTQLISAVPSALQNLSSPLQAGSSEASGMLSSFLDPANLTSMAGSGGSNLVGVLSNMLGVVSSAGGATPPAPALTGTAGPTLIGAASLAGMPGRGGIGAGLSAGLGKAGSVGMLSVPPAWAANAATGGSPATALPGATLAAAAERGPGTMPAGLPIGAPGPRAGTTASATSYGFRPTVVPHPVAAG